MSDDRINDLAQRVEKLEDVVFDIEGRNIRSSGKKLSVREFMNDYDTSSHRKKFLVIGYYLEKYESYDNFTSSDLENYYRRAKVQISSNTSQFINECAKKGWMMEGGERTEDNEKTWIVTQTGEAKVQNDFKEDDG